MIGATAALTAATPALAALPTGAKAPTFEAPAYQAGKPFQFKLAEALKDGPVVLYFFPAAHTKGCNIEAHEFADAMDKFKAQGATVIGVTGGHVDELAAFSSETAYCSGKFPVAADPTLSVSKSYDAIVSFGPAKFANRTSYVIAPDGEVLFSYTNLAPEQHISLSLDALTKWRAAHPR
jgi:peroxiredoxin